MQPAVFRARLPNTFALCWTRSGDAESFWMCEEFARAQVPDEVVQALRVGRMTALQKSSGGVRGIAVGDFGRRLVARAQPSRGACHVSFPVCVDHQNLGANVSRMLPRHSQIWGASATLLSVDGIGAFDLISRGAVLQWLLEVEGGGSVLPFVRQFYGSPSTCWWDDHGVTHDIVQGEGGSKETP